MNAMRYKASFEGTDHSTEGRNALLAISVGKDYHEGGKLSAAVDLINRRAFAHVTIGVGDTLQRHNFPERSASQRHASARRAGDAWLARNEDILAAIAAPTRVERWDDYLGHERYPALLTGVQAAYRLDASYREAVDATTDVFLDRLRGRDEPFDAAAEAERSRQYIIEECPVVMPLWAEQGHDFILYPQRLSAAMARTRALFVEATRPDKARWLPIKFKRRGEAPIATGEGPLRAATGDRA